MPICARRVDRDPISHFGCTTTVLFINTLKTLTKCSPSLDITPLCNFYHVGSLQPQKRGTADRNILSQTTAIKSPPIPFLLLDVGETNSGLTTPLRLQISRLGTNPTRSFPGVNSNTNPLRFIQNGAPKTVGISFQPTLCLYGSLGKKASTDKTCSLSL